jgi:hypothetical protein
MGVDIVESVTIEQVLRPVSQASRVLRDWQNSGSSSLMAVTDDPPTLATLDSAIDAVKASLASSVTREDAEPLIRQMAPTASAATIDALVAAVVDRDQLSLTLDGRLPTPAVAMVASKYRGAAELPSAEIFFKQCVRERHSLEELLHRLKLAQRTMRRELGWR